MQKYPSIEQFRSVKRAIEMHTQFVSKDETTGEITVDRTRTLPTVEFAGTVKIHGTCSAVRIENGEYKCQSREREITPSDDNAGFARFIAALPQDLLKNVFGDNVVVHGEWAGQGVQPKVAVSQLPKFYTVFAVSPLQESYEYRNFSELNTAKNIEKLNVHRIFLICQFKSFKVTVDFEKPETAVETMNRLTLQVENECPVGKFFGISGVGEGIVWKPTDPKYNDSRFVFKTKGEKHSASKVNVLATVDVVKAKSVDDFVARCVHEGRLQQGFNWLAENKHEQTEKSTGLFIKWVTNDVLKEEMDTLTASGLTPKDINGNVSSVARKWYFAKLNAQ